MNRAFIVVALVVISSIGAYTVRPVQAAEWSECSVTQLNPTIPNGSDSTFQGGIDQVPLDRSFILTQSRGSTLHTSADKILTASRIEQFGYWFSRGTSAGTELYLTAQVITCPSELLSVTHGQFSLNSGQDKTTVNLNRSYDPNRTFVIMSGSVNDSGYGEASGSVIGSINPNNNSQLSVSRYSQWPVSVNIQYQIIEFTQASAVTVQRGDEIIGEGEASITTTTDAIGNPLSSSESRTWLFCQDSSNTNGSTQAGVGCELSSSNAVTIHRYKPSIAKNNVQFFLVKFPTSAATVERGVAEIDSNQPIDTLANEDIAVSDTGLDGHYFPFVSITSNDDTSQLFRDRWSLTMPERNIIRLSSQQAETNSDLDAIKAYWQVIRFDTTFRPKGWGWIGNSAVGGAGGVGLISFQCSNLSDTLGTPCSDGTNGTRQDYGVTVESGGCNEACDITGAAWVGHYDIVSGEPTTIGYISFDPDISEGVPTQVGNDPNTSEDEQLDAHWNEVTGEVYGWARFETLNEYSSQNEQDPNDWGWIKLRGNSTNPAASEYGVRFDVLTGRFSGWAWSGDGTIPGTNDIAEGSGFGWVKFDTDVVSPVTQAYLKTRFGNVYARDGIALAVAPPLNEYNAMYLIESGGDVVNFTSEYDAITQQQQGQQQNWQTSEPNFEPITNGQVLNTPTSVDEEKIFSGELGTLYINALIEKAVAKGTAQVGNCNTTLFQPIGSALNRRVLYCDGDLTINQNVTFYNGVGAASGAGTIVVNGDLYINDNMAYFNSALSSSVHNLASVAWIVLGDVIISPNVTQVVGAFTVLEYNNEGGAFITGASNLGLKVKGLVVARQFVLQRGNVGSDAEQRAAEEFIYDGRVAANIPPGLDDLRQVLPTYNE